MENNLTPFERTALTCENIITSMTMLGSVLQAESTPAAAEHPQVTQMIALMLEGQAMLLAASNQGAEA